MVSDRARAIGREWEETERETQALNERLARTDFSIEAHGLIVLVRPLTPEAEEWLDEHTDGDGQWFGGALAVEPRYVVPLAEGILEAGFQL